MEKQKNRMQCTFNRRRLWLIFGLCFLAWSFAYLMLPPPFAGTDVFYFKDAAINLVTNRGFTTVATFGNETLTPQPYTTYPPLFPLVYAGYLLVAGIGPIANASFDLLVCAGASLLFCAMLLRGKQSPLPLPDKLAVVVVSLTLPLGLYGAPPDRPDGFALLLLSGALTILIYRFDPGAAFGAGVLVGLAALASPFGGIVGVLALATHLYVRSTAERKVLAFRNAAAAALGAAMPVLAVGLLTVVFDPSLLERFIGVATGRQTSSRTGIGLFLSILHGHAAPVLDVYAEKYAALRPRLMLLQSAAVALTAIWFVFAARRYVTTRHRLAVFGLFAIAAPAIPIVLVPYQVYYPLLASGAILVALVALRPILPEKLHRRHGWTVFASLMICLALQLPFLAQTLIIRAQLGPSYSRMKAVLAALEPATGPTPLRIACHAPQYFLFRQLGMRPIDIWFTDRPAIRAGIDYVALTYTGSSSPIEPHSGPGFDPDGYMLVYRPTMPQRPESFGIPIARTSHSWEVELWRRVRIPASNAR